MTPPKLRIKALDIAIETLNRPKCPVGEWPTVKVLREIRDEIVKELEARNG